MFFCFLNSIFRRNFTLDKDFKKRDALRKCRNILMANTGKIVSLLYYEWEIGCIGCMQPKIDKNDCQSRN